MRAERFPLPASGSFHFVRLPFFFFLLCSAMAAAMMMMLASGIGIAAVVSVSMVPMMGLGMGMRVGMGAMVAVISTISMLSTMGLGAGRGGVRGELGRVRAHVFFSLLSFFVSSWGFCPFCWNFE